LWKVCTAFGDIITKISVNCVINYMLHCYLRVYFYGFILCVVYNCIYIYGYCMYMLHVYVYCYFSMNPCIYIMYLSVYLLYIKFRKSSVCICFNCMQFKNLCGIAQLDVGYVTGPERVVRDATPNMPFSNLVYPKMEMGNHFHGLYHRNTQNSQTK
jgi:hypothetical protein